MSTSWYPHMPVLKTASPNASPARAEGRAPERRAVLQDQQRVGARHRAGAPSRTVKSPRSIVWTTRPRSVRPRNALFPAIEWKGRSPTVHSASGSNTTRFAGAPGATRPAVVGEPEDAGRGASTAGRRRRAATAAPARPARSGRRRARSPARSSPAAPGRTPAPSPPARAARDRSPPRRSSRPPAPPAARPGAPRSAAAGSPAGSCRSRPGPRRAGRGGAASRPR